ncbi:MAG: hypothetical protein AAFW68_04845 [Pseudomonadota bacterium]
MVLAQMIVYFAALYFAIGAVVGLIFLALGVSRLDAAAKGAGVFFRVTIFAGCAVLWPYIVLRWLSGKVINQPIGGQAAGDQTMGDQK